MVPSQNTPTLAPPSIVRTVHVLASKPGAAPYTVTRRADGLDSCTCPAFAYAPWKPCKHQLGIAAGRFIPAGTCPSCRIERTECLTEAVRVPGGALHHAIETCKRMCGSAGGWSVNRA